jgi:integrase
VAVQRRPGSFGADMWPHQHVSRLDLLTHTPLSAGERSSRACRPRGRTRRLSAGEEAKLIDAAGASRSRYLRPLIILAIETGMRRGELLSLAWSNIDFEVRVAHLPLTKNGESRDIPSRPVLSRPSAALRSPTARACSASLGFACSPQLPGSSLVLPGVEAQGAILETG